MNIDRPTRGLRNPLKSRNAQRPASAEKTVARRIPLIQFLPIAVKGHIVACAGEFVGTFLFLLFAYGGTNVVNTAPAEGANATDLAANPAKLLYIALSFGMSLAVNAWVFFRISGGLFNPAVTVGMMLIGATTYLRGALIIVAQILGGISAAAVIQVLFPGPLNVKTSLGGGASVAQGLFIEMFLTAQLVFTIFMLAAEKHAGTFIAPVGIGLSLFIAELMGVYYTGGSLNPARSFGPCVVEHEFSGYHWIYWVGPLLGALLAAAFYMFIKALEYESVNLKPDPREVVGKRFDPDTGKEIFITREGAEVNIGNDEIDAKALAEQGIAVSAAERMSGNTAVKNEEKNEETYSRGMSGNTAVKNEETYSRGPDLERGITPAHHFTTDPTPSTGR